MLDEERLKQVLDAAYSCFTRHGVRRTTMDDIAREAGISRPSVYQYVRNKEDAFRRLVRRMLESTLAEARSAVETAEELTSQLTGALEAKLRLTTKVWRDGPAHAAELLSVDARLSAEPVSEYTSAMRDLLADAITTARAALDATEVAEILLALTRGLEVDLSDPEASVRRLRRGVALVVAGLNHPHTNPKEPS